MAVHGEAIYDTRPWRVFGEGPTRQPAGMFTEGKPVAYTARDVRFTTKGRTLYALIMAPPDGAEVVLEAVGTGEGRVRRVERLGVHGALAFTQSRDALTVRVPPHGAAVGVWVLRISGDYLVERTA